MYFFVFAPLLEDKKVINEINFFAFSRLIKKDPLMIAKISEGWMNGLTWTAMKMKANCIVMRELVTIEANSGANHSPGKQIH